MKYLAVIALTVTLGSYSSAQGPVITSWLQNTTGNGTYYVSGNSTAIDNGILFNCQEISYSSGYVYIQTTGVPVEHGVMKVAIHD
ncbi:MAG: hypothetical protein P8N52_02810, partial [Crocinitomicaceae bacterium]|nr:hypothetical protein [Crocinitomicaceae bacterium]